MKPSKRMDIFPKKLDFLVKHWGPLPRQFPATFPLVHCNYLSGKKEWVRRTFQSCNFSLILAGKGEFHRADRVWPVQAPCVITQWPGEYVEYGPPLDGTWDEFYLIYDAKLLPQFRNVGFINLRRPVWPIHQFSAIRELMENLHFLSRSNSPENAVDRVDRIAEFLLLETLVPPQAETPNNQLRQALQAIRRTPSCPVDFAELAARCGMSISTFRRRWQETFGMPPGQHLLQIRLHEACRLLTETTLPISEIAQRSGFEDEFYFSRRFRLRLNVTPTRYRQLYRQALFNHPDTPHVNLERAQ